ncbi:MAG: hypothetical protein ACK56F_12505 [bacterium]
MTACIASLELLQITCGCSTDGPECESSRENEGQDAELGQAARSHLGSRVFFRVSDPANLANRTVKNRQQMTSCCLWRRNLRHRRRLLLT